MTAVYEPAAPATSAPETELHLGDRMNRLRAGVLGANDGIVSTLSLIHI